MVFDVDAGSLRFLRAGHGTFEGVFPYARYRQILFVFELSSNLLQLRAAWAVNLGARKGDLFVYLAPASLRLALGLTPCDALHAHGLPDYALGHGRVHFEPVHRLAFLAAAFRKHVDLSGPYQCRCRLPLLHVQEGALPILRGLTLPLPAIPLPLLAPHDLRVLLEEFLPQLEHM